MTVSIILTNSQWIYIPLFINNNVNPYDGKMYQTTITADLISNQTRSVSDNLTKYLPIYQKGSSRWYNRGIKSMEKASQNDMKYFCFFE